MPRRKHDRIILPRGARLVLASASPRRADLLRQEGYAFIVQPSHTRELSHKPPSIPISIWPVCVAMAKALAVQRHVRHKDIVLAADTIVAVGGRILNKAHHRGHARRMLQTLSGTEHEVITGLVLLHGRRQRLASATTVCRMKKLAPHWLHRYLDGGHWRGKAGAYGIQDGAIDDDGIVQVVRGEWHNVMGLPLELLRKELAEIVRRE